jgi:hypothetical protein
MRLKDENMPIGKVKQFYRTVTVYDTNNRMLFSKDLGTSYNSSNVGIEGYTGTVVMLRLHTLQGIRLCTFDATGKQLKMESLRK